MAVAEIATGQDPAGIATLLDIGGQRYCDQPQPIQFGGAVWAPLDFVAYQSSDGYSSLQITVISSRRIAASGKWRVMRVGGSDVIYDAQGLDVLSSDHEAGESAVVLGHIGADQSRSIMYSVGDYHGLRRYADPELPAQQAGTDDSAASIAASWYPGRNMRRAAERIASSRDAIQPALRAAIKSPLRAANMIIGQLIARRDGRRTVATPGTAYTPDASLENQHREYQPIPDRYGRTVFAPDIAHPPYCRGGGTQVLRRNVMCIGIGEYAVHRVWIGGSLAWVDGASTGAIPGLIVQKLTPGEQMDLTYISLHSGAPLNANWVPLQNQARYTVDAEGYTVEWLPASGSTETAEVPSQGSFFHRDSTGFQVPAGIALSSVGRVSNVLGKVPASGTYSFAVHVANIPALYTDIQYDQIMLSARRLGISAPGITVFHGRVDGSPLMGDLSRTSATSPNTNYNDLTFSLSGSGRMMLAVARSDPTGSVPWTVCDIAIRPTFRPFVGSLSATHLRVDYTASNANVSLPIVVEASRLIDGVPSDRVGESALASIKGAIDSSAIDAATFDALTDTCGGASSGETPWETLTQILATSSARPVWRGGRLQAVRDVRDAAPVMMLTPRSIRRPMISRNNRLATIDGASVTYTNSLTGTVTSETFLPPGSAGADIAAIDAAYCTSASQAQMLARDTFLALRRQSAAADIDIGDEGCILAPVDRVLICCPDQGEGVGYGVMLPGDSWTAAAPAGSVACVVYVRNPDGSPNGPHAAQLGPDGKLYGAASTPSITLPTHGAEWGAWAEDPYRWIIADMSQRAEGGWNVQAIEERYAA